MKVSRREKSVADKAIYEDRAQELAETVIRVLRDGGRGHNYSVIRDVIIRIAAERFRRYHEERGER